MSELKRFFVDSVSEETVLEGEEFEHAKNVLRLGVGNEVILLDNSGKEYTAEIVDVGKKNMLLRILKTEEGDREATTDVVLLFGFLKNADKNEFIVQKATELGVKKLIAFSSDYSSAYMNDNKLDRLNKVAKESAKQCLRSVAPSVEYCKTLSEALKQVKKCKNKIFACEFANGSDTDMSTMSGSTALVIGSEGGFSRDEEALAKKEGFSSVSLGKRILRAETAAVALTSVVMFSLGELGEMNAESDGEKAAEPSGKRKEGRKERGRYESSGIYARL